MSGCSTFVDRSADSASRALKWDFGVVSLPERCMKIKVGQTVKFTSDGATTAADFTSHPVSANGGDANNPVASVDTTTGDLKLTVKGTFGFVCGNHPAMLGAFQVVE